MNIVHDILAGPPLAGPLAMTIGSFDGVHLGHRALLESVQENAKRLGGESALLTLAPHPQQFFRPDDPPVLLTTNGQKEKLLDELGLDHLLYLPFNAETSRLTREQFLEDILLDRCHMKSLVIGHDFRFGRGAEGDFDYLQQHAEAKGFEVQEFPPFSVEGARVSSTLIRDLLSSGEVENIPKFLGRPHSVSGTVVTGRGMGRQLGFPTANIDHRNAALPKDGVYIATASIPGFDKEFMAAVNIGFAPTFGTNDRILEAYILDFDGDLAGSNVSIAFQKCLRGEQAFESKEKLVAAIQNDVAAVRKFFTAGNKIEPSGFNTP